MGDPKGFLKTARETPRRRPVDVRLTDWREVYEPFAAERAERQAARCMDCGIPFCHQGCPLGNLIPEWNDLVYKSDWAGASGEVVPIMPTALTGFSVAVVGSGPAGLAAAQQLTRAGHEVTVFERDDAPGGLLRYGIPEFKMEKRHLERRLEQMRAEGTEFRAGVNMSADELDF